MRLPHVQPELLVHSKDQILQVDSHHCATLVAALNSTKQHETDGDKKSGVINKANRVNREALDQALKAMSGHRLPQCLERLKRGRLQSDLFQGSQAALKRHQNL